MVGHGKWLPYLNDQVRFSERTARSFMRAATEFSNRQAFADLAESTTCAGSLVDHSSCSPPWWYTRHLLHCSLIRINDLHSAGDLSA